MWSIFAADAPLFVAGSFVCALVNASRRSWAVFALAIHTGSAWYAGLFAVGQSLTVPHTWPGAAMMAPCMIILPLMLWIVARESPAEPRDHV